MACRLLEYHGPSLPLDVLEMVAERRATRDGLLFHDLPFRHQHSYLMEAQELLFATAYDHLSIAVPTTAPALFRFVRTARRNAAFLANKASNLRQRAELILNGAP
ncbi:hypothetical protein [Azospirillum sp. B506]|uniref:hypothetical protein n=1 Tax=Azospirillum sp. B506 TaxID=137721 RepID=UPI0003458F50|nr:hypothetical protein [Azospirillum sp. B506]